MRNRKLLTSALRRAHAGHRKSTLGRETLGLLALVGLALVGCARPAATEDVEEPAVTPARFAPRLVIVPELAMQAVAAADLWSAATHDVFAPDLTIGQCGADEDLCIRIVDELPIGCGAQVRGAVACYRGPTIDVWQGARDDWRVSVVAHELGHSLGLGHGHAGLMSPDRDRTRPCIEADDLSALDEQAGIVGSPACVR